MKKITFLLAAIIFIFSHYICFSQIDTNKYVYDSIGVKVDMANDFIDTLTAIPRTHAKIRLPKFFEHFEYKEFNGFIHMGTSTTLMVYEYPQTSVMAYVGSMGDSLFKASGMELLQVFDQKQNNGDDAKVYILRVRTEKVPVIRIMYFTGNYNTMYYLMANIPEVVSKLLRNVVLASFQTLEY